MRHQKAASYDDGHVEVVKLRRPAPLWESDTALAAKR
jgi:hypothetical protein